MGREAYRARRGRTDGPTWWSKVEEEGSASGQDLFFQVRSALVRGRNCNAHLNLGRGGRPRLAHGVSAVHGGQTVNGLRRIWLWMSQ